MVLTLGVSLYNIQSVVYGVWFQTSPMYERQNRMYLCKA